MKVGSINTSLNCRPIGFSANEQGVAKTDGTAFSSHAQGQVNLSIEKKYELAKQIIAAQSQMIESLQKQIKTGLPSSNILNRYA